MKLSCRLPALLLALAIGLAGCSGGVPDLGSESSPQSSPQTKPEPSLEPQTESESQSGSALKGVEGKYVVVEKRDWTEPGDTISLKGTVQEGGAVILLWELGNKPEDESIVVEVVDADDGSVRYRYLPEVWCTGIEATGEQPEDYRLNTSDGVRFLCSTDGQKSDEYTLPEAVRNSLWREDGSSVPGVSFDVLRPADLVAYCAADGIYICDLDGNNLRKVLDNTAIQSWFHYWGIDKELPAYQASQLHYIAPLLMNGGRKLAATTYLAGTDAYESLCVGVTTIDLETMKISNYPDPLGWLSPPARRAGGDTLMTCTDVGYQFINVSTEIPEDILFGDEELTDMTCDYRTFLRFQPDFDSGGKKTTALVSFPGDNVQEMTPHLTVAGWQYVELLDVTESFAVCRVGNSEEEFEILLAPYR